MKTVEYRFASLLASAALASIVVQAFPLSPAQSAPPKAAETRKAAASPLATQDAQIIQILNRLGFGPRPEDLDTVRAIGVSRYIESQLNPNGIDDSAVERKLAALPSLRLTLPQLANAYESDRVKQQQNKATKKSAQSAKPVNAEMQDGKTPDMTMEANAAPTNSAQQPVVRPLAQNPKLQKAYSDRAENILAEAERNGFDRGISTQIVGEMQTAKLVRAVESKRQLQEVLVDFWTNHFNVDVKKNAVRTLRLADERDAIRPHVLGKFRDMLEASAKSPAMLIYLDNARSTKAVVPGENLNRNGRNRRRPNAPAAKKARGGVNENYAREIMELHTLGVNGGYTQKDVQEVARCFTGWSYAPQTGEFIFRPGAHDDGSKVVLGHNIAAGGGISDGEQVLDILASHPSTAHHLAFQLCQRFVADAPPDALVDRAAQAYRDSDGDLKATTRAILTSPEFMSGANMGNKIKSPFEFVVSAVRAMDGAVVVPNASMPRQRLLLISNGQASSGRNVRPNARNKTLPREMAEMGQPMYGCQPPTGYPEDSSNWVSAGALVSRLNFALALTNGSYADVQANPARVDTTGDAASLVRSASLQLLGKPLTPTTEATIVKQIEADATPDAKKVQALILGSPEFQRR